MKQPTVSVVIPNWNGKEVIGDCLKSIITQNFKPTEVIVVENGSTDGSAQYIRSNFPKINLVEIPKNLGFAGGVNVGIKDAKGDYVFLFNNDAVADKNCLKNLVATATKTKADITAAIILTDNDSKIDSDGDVYTIYGLPFPRHRGLPPNYVPTQDEQIFSASGGASLYQKTLFDQIGYFDEAFFAYYEDIDLCMRAQLQAKSVWLSHKAVVHHVMGHTSNKVPGFGREMTIRNSIYLFWKDLPVGVFLKVLPRFIYANLRLTAAAFVKGHPYRAIRAHLTALIHLPSLLTKRHKIQKNRKLSSAEYAKLLSKDNPFKALAGRK
jgi:GT2 family glycosyltransferase